VALNGIACVTPQLCIAVGGSSLGTLAEEWTGTAWSVQTTPSPAGGAVLSSVSCVSATACEAVGDSGTGPLAEAWNGTGWTVQPAPSAGGASLASVSCTARTRCVAVGSNSAGPVAEGWNGTRWARQPGLPPRHHSPSKVPVALNGVWCSSALSCTGVGYADGSSGQLLAVATWKGKKWTWSANGDAGAFTSISCSVKLCLAVGYRVPPNPPIPLQYLLAVVDPGNNGGTVVNPVLPPHDGFVSEFSGVSCRSAVCEAVGNHSMLGDPPQDTLAERARGNGTTWSFQSTPSPGPGSNADDQLAGIACTSATACIAVGSANGAPLAEAYSS
jgi:hypothetical protein